jgi:outer membrane murein-binding lipoprotein Lpp
MTERQEKRTLERKEIAARVATFKATQEKFQKDREKYYAATMEAARAVKKNESSGGKSRR